MAAPDVRTRILDAAHRLLAQSGPAALTQPKVSRAAGVSQSHLTYYFPKRTDLLVAIARHAVEGTLARLRDAGGAAPEDVAALLQARLADKRLVRLLVGLIVAAGEDPALKASLRDFVAGVRAMLREAVAAGGIALDDDALATLHATLVGAAVLNLARDDAASRREIRAVVARAFAHLPAPRRRTATRRRA